jgi:uncharacterized membrane protein
MPPVLDLFIDVFQNCALAPSGCVTVLVTLCGVMSWLMFTQAIHTSAREQWGIYTLTLIVGLYIHPLFGLIMIAQGLFLRKQIQQHQRDSRKWVLRAAPYCFHAYQLDTYLFKTYLSDAYWGSTLFALATWMPWLSIVLHPA